MADYRSQLLDQQPFGGPLMGGAQPSALASALTGPPPFQDGTDPMAAATSYLSSIAPRAPAPAPQQPYRGAILPISSGEDGQIHFDSNAGVLGAVKNAFTLPHDVYTGQVDPMSQEGIARATDMAATLGSGAPIPKPAGTIGIFGGRNAATANPKLFDLADRASEQGMGDARLLGSSGIFPGADGRMRFEIPDYSAGYAAQPNGTSGLVGDVLDHPGLCAAYPDLAKIPIGYVDMGAGRLGSFDGETVMLNSELPADQSRSVLLHELQHAVQERENFARGGHTQSDGVGANNDEIMSSYRALAGEVEARNVQSRSTMTPEQLVAQPPWMTQDTPYINQNPQFELTNGAIFGNAPRLLDNAPLTPQQMKEQMFGGLAPGAPAVPGVEGTGFFYPNHPNVQANKMAGILR